jgi:hypothetical protein
MVDEEALAVRVHIILLINRPKPQALTQIEIFWIKQTIILKS